MIVASLARPGRPPDWWDTFTGPVARTDWSAREVFEHAERNMPRWVAAAMSIRNRIVKPFGLITGDGELKLSTLPIVEERRDAFETGLEDRHLTFTLRTELQQGIASVTTRIWFNNWLGRPYLAAVWIGHKLILRRALQSIAAVDNGKSEP